MLTEREQFCAVLSAGPLHEADAVIMLCGEDTEARIATTQGLFLQRTAKTIVLSGGLDAPPRVRSASSVFPVLLGKGIHPDAILLDNESQHTREQAVTVVALAKAKDWHRLLLVASPYHAPRAFLTFVHALDEVSAADTLHVVSVPAAHAPWFQTPNGHEVTRLELLTREYGKIDEYQAKGHVASYARGLAYLKRWEGR